MLVGFHFSVRVKFRVFGVTLGIFEGAWLVRASEGKLAWLQIAPESEPEAAKVLHDRHGLRVAAWL